jgi:hypothetical protein
MTVSAATIDNPANSVLLGNARAMENALFGIVGGFRGVKRPYRPSGGRCEPVCVSAMVAAAIDTLNAKRDQR